MPDADAPLPRVTVPRLPWGSQGSWGQGSVPWNREDADSLQCPSQDPLPVQEQRRAERAEQQRIRSEREKERQARMAVSVLWNGAWGVWGHKLCVHLSTAEHLLTLAGRKSSQGGRGGTEEGRGGGTEEEGVLQHAALWGLHAEGGTPPRGAVMEPLLLLGRVWPRADLIHVTVWSLQAGEGRELLLGQGLQGRRELRAAPSSALQMCSSSLASGTGMGMGTRTRCLVLYCQNVLKDLMCFLSSKS